MITFEQVRQAVNLPGFDGFSAQMNMAPAGRSSTKPTETNPPRQSAVMVLIFPQAGAGLHILLTRRTETLRGHSGQISFPGGRRDPADASYQVTALRETCEEVGICGGIQVIGELTRLWIPPSNFDVYPFVGIINHLPQITPNPAEVAEVLALPLSDLINPGIKRMQKQVVRGTAIDAPYYDVGGHVVWGATAMMLSEFEQRLRTIV